MAVAGQVLQVQTRGITAMKMFKPEDRFLTVKANRLAPYRKWNIACGTADCFRQEPDPSVLDAVSDGEDVTNDLHTYISKVEMDNFMGSGSDWNVNSVHNSNIFIQIEQMHR